MSIPPMNRRDALKATAAVLGGVLFVPSSLRAAPARGEATARAGVLTPEDEALIEEIADTLLPTTPSSPGAKAAGAGAAINLLLTDCHEPSTQEIAVKGLAEFRRVCDDRFGAGFATLSRTDREAFLRELDAVAQRAGHSHYFVLIRELTLHAYFSSEIGMTKAKRFVLAPGRWEGCVPLAPGQPAWS